MKNFLRSAALVVAGLSFAATASAGSWDIDTVHSDLSFKVRHLVSKTSGHFNQWSGTIEAEPGNFEEGSVQLTIQVDTIDTGNEKRDGHLKSDDFFNAEKWPTITFVSTGIEDKGDDLYHVTGDLTIRDVTEQVTIPVEFLGSQEAMGGTVAGFEGELTINRKDFGVNWNKTLDQGGLLLGEDVEISFTIEARLQQPEASES